MKNRALINNRKAHVLFVVENNQVPQDTRVWKEAQAIKEAGHKVSIICPNIIREKPGYKTIEEIDVYQYRNFLEGARTFGLLLEYFLASISIILYSLKIYSKNPFNIIHLANPPDFLIILFFPYKFLKVKIIFDHHDLSPELFIEKFESKSLLYKLLLFFEKLSYLLSDIIIVTNNSIKKTGGKRNNIRADKIFVVRNGPDLKIVHSYSIEKKLEKRAKYLVGFVGKMDPQDGLLKLVYSVEHIVQNRGFKDFRVLLIGDGTDRKRIERVIKNKMLEEYFIFHGAEYNKEKLFRLLSSVDVCVDPAKETKLSNKSTHIKISEYMALEKPIIQYNRNEGRLSATKASYYIKNNDEKAFGDAIVHLLKNEKEREEMGKYGMKRVKKYFHWGIQKKILLQVYNKILN